MSELFRRMRGASRPSEPEEVLADLVEFHTARPGVTEATLGVCRTRDGQTGYDVLVDRVPAEARAVLDLGCGNGPLIARLIERRPGLSRIVGVDACASDLDLARRRAPDGRVELRCEAGQELAIEDESMDAVLSHHAFYLMVPVEPVIAHIARVLRPGGVFAFVTVSDKSDQFEPFHTLIAEYGARTARENPHFKGWGDRRVFSKEGLDALLTDFEHPLHIDEHVLEIAEPASALCERLMSFFYSVELQAPETRAELARVWTTELERTRTDDGNAHLQFPFACVWVKKAN